MEKMWQRGGIIRIDSREIGLDFGLSMHSEGIAGIRNCFGIGESPLFGYDARKITRVPDFLSYRNQGDASYMILDERSDFRYQYADGHFIRVPAGQKQNEARIDYILSSILTPLDNHCDFSAAVGEDGFAVHASNKTYGRILDDLVVAFAEDDVVIDGRSRLVGSFGLLIYSRIPDQIKEEFRKQDESAYIKKLKSSAPATRSQVQAQISSSPHNSGLSLYRVSAFP